MIDLDNITLISVSSVKIPEAINAIKKSKEKINFYDTILVSDERPIDLPSDINYEHCDKITNIKEYSYYMIYNLHKHIKSDFCLVVQYDGYVSNPDKWNDEFLNWDYIGAPWPIKEDAYIDPFGNHIRVGNGGFSFRSKKLIELPTFVEIPFEVNVGDFYKHMNAGCYSEDGNISVHNRHIFEENGCKFAPVDIAAQFSRESNIPENQGIEAFGFHGR